VLLELLVKQGQLVQKASKVFRENVGYRVCVERSEHKEWQDLLEIQDHKEYKD
jgi:hypothetical protein